jgi:hypothetical protein
MPGDKLCSCCARLKEIASVERDYVTSRVFIRYAPGLCCAPAAFVNFDQTVRVSVPRNIAK